MARGPVLSEAQEIERLVTAGRFGEAVGRAEALVARNARDVRALLLLARARVGLGRLAAADDAAERGLRIAPGEPSLELVRGVIEHRLGRADAAIARLTSLLARRPPESVEVAVALASALERAGRREELSTLVASDGPWKADARWEVYSAGMRADVDRGAAIRELDDLCRRAASPALRRVAGFEAVRLLDAEGRYREAFDLAAWIHRETTPPFDVGEIEEEAGVGLRALERGTVRPVAGPTGIAAPVDVALVVGLPRSGTTLLEQMLDRHPDIEGIGEFEGMLEIRDGLVERGLWPQVPVHPPRAERERLARAYADAARIRRRTGARIAFDKSLHAWRLLPALAAVLPGAAFVHVERDARDCAISMFLSNFHPKSWGFTRDLASIRRVVALERALAGPMREALGLRGTRVAYEDLVDAPEREIRRVLDALGVAFDPAVLAPERNPRAVLTLSHRQVRAPIGRASIGRWRNYAFAFDAAWEPLAGGLRAR